MVICHSFRTLVLLLTASRCSVTVWFPFVAHQDFYASLKMLIKSTQNKQTGTRKSEPVCLLLCSKYLPAGLINLSLMSLLCGFSLLTSSELASLSGSANISNYDCMGAFSLTDLELCGVIWHSFSSPWRFPTPIRTVCTCACDCTAEWENKGRKQRSQENIILAPFSLF